MIYTNTIEQLLAHRKFGYLSTFDLSAGWNAYGYTH